LVASEKKFQLTSEKRTPTAAFGVPSSIRKNLIKTRYMMVKSIMGLRIDQRWPIKLP
jgi:hypothetical protein